MLTTIAITAAILLIALAAASLYFYHVAIARNEKSHLNGNPDLEFQPAELNSFEASARWFEAQPFDRWQLTSSDGLKLNAYYLPASEPTAKTVILAHGYAGRASTMGNLAKFYREQLGYNILTPDARGHGMSEGDHIGFGWPERQDYLGWISQVIDVVGPQAQIVLHGISMGAATVLMTSGEPLPPNVKAVVADCGYTSAYDQLAYQLKRMYHLPAFPLMQLTSLVTKLRAGYFFGEASALNQVKESKTPTLFIHGDDDTFVPVKMVHELYANCSAEKELLIVPDAGHGSARTTDGERYDRTVTQFLNRYVE